MRILAIGDTANVITTLRKFVNKTKIDLILFPIDGNSKHLTINPNCSFFISNDVLEQVNHLLKIKNEYDLCIVTGWAGARLAYLADLNYIIWFLGDDIRWPLFEKHSRPHYLTKSTNNLNIFERIFYKHVLKNSIFCVAMDTEVFSHLRNYRDKEIGIIGQSVDITKFNPNIKPLKLKKTKFTFFSPSRIGIQKGVDILWKAIPLCKSDFEILQVEWYDKRSEEEKQLIQKLMKNKPSKVKLIPMIKPSEIAIYYMFADAIMGQMRWGIFGNIEREAAFCKKPVISYYNPKFKFMVDGKELQAAFLPNSNDPKIVAKIIDKVVTSKDFREALANDEHEFIKKIAHPQVIVDRWEELFENLIFRKKISIKKSSRFKIKFRLFCFLVANQLHLNKIKHKIL